MDFRCKSAEEMTPEERLERVIEILAIASVRLAEEEVSGNRPLIPETPLDSSEKPL